MKRLKVFEAFAGYGSQHIALKRLRDNFPYFDFEVVGISEIEPTALRAYKAIHGDCPNYGDIAKIDWGGVLISTSLRILSHAPTSAMPESKRASPKARELAPRCYGNAKRRYA